MSCCTTSSCEREELPPESTPEPPASLRIPLTVPDATKMLFSERRFLRLLGSFCRDQREELMKAAALVRTEEEFQRAIGLPLLEAILRRTATDVEFVGLENLTAVPSCLFVSNHRDIVLDPALLNGSLIRAGRAMPHVAVGNNLLQAGWMQAFFRLCKCFVIQRDAKGKQLYEQSRNVSQFVRTALETEQTVWIAQRPGRTKDGIDKTEPALLRMLLLAYEGNVPPSTVPLYVTPLAVSYEYEPCDVHKAAHSIGAETRNSPEERARRDTLQILRGLVQPKGRIRFAVRPPMLVPEPSSLPAGMTRTDQIAALAQSVDAEIARGYAVWSTNYVAQDLLQDGSEFRGEYAPDEREAFEEYLRFRALEIAADPLQARHALLSLYARPVQALRAS